MRIIDDLCASPSRFPLELVALGFALAGLACSGTTRWSSGESGAGGEGTPGGDDPCALPGSCEPCSEGICEAGEVLDVVTFETPAGETAVRVSTHGAQMALSYQCEVPGETLADTVCAAGDWMLMFAQGAQVNRVGTAEVTYAAHAFVDGLLVAAGSRYDTPQPTAHVDAFADGHLPAGSCALSAGSSFTITDAAFADDGRVFITGHLSGGFTQGAISVDGDAAYVAQLDFMGAGEPETTCRVGWLQTLALTPQSMALAGSQVVVGGYEAQSGAVHRAVLDQATGAPQIRELGGNATALVIAGNAAGRSVLAATLQGSPIDFGDGVLAPRASFDFALGTYEPVDTLVFSSRHGLGAVSGGSVDVALTLGGVTLVGGTFHNTLALTDEGFVDDGDGDGFVAAFDSGGAVRWARHVAGAVEVQSVAYDSSGRVHAAGVARGPFRIDDARHDGATAPGDITVITFGERP